MFISPAVLALTGASLTVALLVSLAAGFAVQVLRHWDLADGSEAQLRLERRTYLIATILAYAFAVQIAALLLYIYNAEQMSSQFVGAMCATGVLNVNAYGWPALLLKIAVFLLGAVWLVLNYVDNQGCDYPLIRVKYALLLAIVPLVIGEALVQWLHFLNMDPDVITSCCGSLFSADAEGVAAELAGLAPLPAMAVFYSMGAVLPASGMPLLARGAGGWIFAAASLAAFAVALAAIVSFVSLYVYEQPHHHCPFCILKAGYGYVGYYFYIPLFAATAFGLGAGVLTAFRHVASIGAVVRSEAKRLAWMALFCHAVFYLVVTVAIVRSNLRLVGG